MNILFWNARGLGAATKRRILHDVIFYYKVNIIADKKK
jgi:hypothetical protein